MGNQPSNEELKIRLAKAEAAVEKMRQSELDSAGGRWRVDKSQGEPEQAESESSLAGEVADLKSTVPTLRNEISEWKHIEAELKTSEQSGQPPDLSAFYQNLPV